MTTYVHESVSRERRLIITAGGFYSEAPPGTQLPLPCPPRDLLVTDSSRVTTKSFVQLVKVCVLPPTNLCEVNPTYLSYFCNYSTAHDICVQALHFRGSAPLTSENKFSGTSKGNHTVPGVDRTRHHH